MCISFTLHISACTTTIYLIYFMVLYIFPNTCNQYQLSCDSELQFLVFHLSMSFTWVQTIIHHLTALFKYMYFHFLKLFPFNLPCLTVCLTHAIANYCKLRYVNVWFPPRPHTNLALEGFISSFDFEVCCQPSLSCVVDYYTVFLNLKTPCSQE